MQTQTIQFAVESKDGGIKRIGRSSIYQPKTNYKGNGIKWYEDKPRKGGVNNGR